LEHPLIHLAFPPIQCLQSEGKIKSKVPVYALLPLVTLPEATKFTPSKTTQVLYPKCLICIGFLLFNISCIHYNGKIVVVPAVTDFFSISWFSVVLRYEETPSRSSTVVKSSSDHIPVYACCPVIIISSAFHSQTYPGLDDKLYGYAVRSMGLTWIQSSALLLTS
jgi:hypothetical protein